MGIDPDNSSITFSIRWGCTHPGLPGYRDVNFSTGEVTIEAAVQSKHPVVINYCPASDPSVEISETFENDGKTTVFKLSKLPNKPNGYDSEERCESKRREPPGKLKARWGGDCEEAKEDLDG